MGLKEAIALVCMLCVAAAQTNTCYANCKAGYCLPGNALACTDCDLGLIPINNMCIGGSSQAAPVTYLKPTSKGLADTASLLNCSVSTSSSSTRMLFSSTIGSTFTRAFSLPSKHIYLQVKFNAIVAGVGTSPFSPTLLLNVLTTVGQTIYTTSRSFNSSGNPVSCTGNYQAYDVFTIDDKFASADQTVLVQVRATGANNVNVALSNFQLYFGNCSNQCGQCFGPTNQECLSCRGLLAVIANNKCAGCNPGFYQSTAGNCMACPVECSACSLVSNQPKCITCNQDIAFTVNSPLGCQTNYSKVVQAAEPTFTSSSWISSETLGSSVTTCGYYSLVGGVSIGVAGSSIRRSYSNLPAHTTLYIYFTLFLIDQSEGDFNAYEITVDGQRQNATLSISAPQGSVLTNQCGTSSLELATRQAFQFIHNASSATITISFLKDYAGIRDISLVVNNQTSVENCYSESNGSCVACRNGLALLNNTCSACGDGYYFNGKLCIVCPITCKTCGPTSGQPTCLSCQPPLVLDGNFCIDGSAALFASDVVDGVATASNSWTLYPHLQNNGLTTCGGSSILGSSDIKFKFLSMKRTFTGLPAHSGIAVAFQFYQIDDYANDESVKFILNNNTTIYRPSNLKMDLCGNSSPDAIAPVYLTDNAHTASTLDFAVKIDRMGKIGIRNLMVYLLNTANAQPPFTVETVPTYSVTTPPVKGITVRLLFPQPFTITNGTDSAFQFAIKSSSGRLLQDGNIAVVQNSTNNANRALEYLLDVQQDLSGSQLEVRATSPNALYFTDSSGNHDLISQQSVTATLPRYVNMDLASVTDRSSCRNLFNLFRGCAILGLFIGMASFIVGMSAAFDDFLILCQLIFVHVFIQLQNNPPSLRVPFEGLHIVQFLEWLPWEARQSIEDAILPGNLYQQSPLVYTQYFQDIVFARTIYHAILFLAAVGVIWVVIHVLLAVWGAKHPNVKYQNYVLYYYQSCDTKKLALIDKVVRFAYFTVVWACVLQCTHLANQPHGFNIWNTILTILLFVLAAAYPAAIFFYIRYNSTTMSLATFNKRYEEIRINPDKLYYFLVRYYKLAAIACVIGFLYASSPVIPLIILIVLNLADAVLLIFADPLGMAQPELIEATIFYPKYPKVYQLTTIIQQGLFIILQILFLVLYGQRNSSSPSSYMGMGYTICAVAILLLINGLVRLFWGFMKQAQHCYLQRQGLEQSIEKEVNDNKDPVEQHPIVENYKSQMNVSKRELSRLQSKKMSFVSKIRS